MFRDSGIPTANEEKPGLLPWVMESVQRGLKRMRRLLKAAGRKIDRLLIATLMKWGY